MRRTLFRLLGVVTLLHGSLALAQMHKVTKPEQVVRAIGVYEWTGDLKKPNASRLVPVTLFIDGALQDAGVYLARPIPFALTPGNEYELEQAGMPKGVLDLSFARHIEAEDATFEDGWFGYGSYKPLPPEKKQPVLRAARTPGVVTTSKDDGRPHLDNKTGQTTGNAGSSGKADSPAGDPDRPTMRRREADTAPASSGGSSDTASTSPADDADRPTLRRRSPEDSKKKQPDNDVATVTSKGSLNDDPDRPNLHRGKPAGSMNDTDLPKLTGLPAETQQMVAVSDPVNRQPHEFSRPWDNEKERASVLASMAAIARQQIKSYSEGSTPGKTKDVEAPPAPTRGNSAARRSPPVRRVHGVASAVPPDIPLVDEQLKAYNLSYGGAPTYVYSAHTAGTGAELQYVTLVAQADLQGNPKIALASVTDAAHLDRTPRMRFVDVVDVESSNRASLLFEQRSANSRTFAVYRLTGPRAEQIFTTGTTQ